MSAALTRKQARRNVEQAFQAALEEVMPRDESRPLRGRTFLDFEEQVWEAGSKLLAHMIEQRAALDQAAFLEQGGRCPHCGSERVYLEKKDRLRKFLSPCGPVEVRLQDCRCRQCGGSFSPSGAGMGLAQRSAAHPAGAAASGAGGGGAVL